MIVHIVLSGSTIDGVDTTWPDSVWLNEEKANARVKELRETRGERNRFFQVEEMDVEDAD